MECSMHDIVLDAEDEEKMMAFYSNVLKLPLECSEDYRTGKVPFPSVP